MKIMKYMFVALLCVSAVLFAAAPSGRPGSPGLKQRIDQLVADHAQAVLRQDVERTSLIESEVEPLMMDYARLSGSPWFYPQDIEKTYMALFGRLNGYNQRTGEYDLPEGLQRVLKNRLVHLSTFQQTTNICGFASLANLYAIAWLLNEGRSITAPAVKEKAIYTLSAIVENPIFKALEAADLNQFAYASTDQLDEVAADIGLNEEGLQPFVFATTEAANTIQVEKGSGVRIFEVQTRPAFKISLFPGDEDRTVQNKARDIVDALAQNKVVNFILNLGQSHFAALSVVNVRGNYTMYYINSLNKQIDFSARDQSAPEVKLIRFVDMLIEFAKSPQRSRSRSPQPNEVERSRSRSPQAGPASRSRSRSPEPQPVIDLGSAAAEEESLEESVTRCLQDIDNELATLDFLIQEADPSHKGGLMFKRLKLRDEREKQLKLLQDIKAGKSVWGRQGYCAISSLFLQSLYFHIETIVS